MLTPRLMVFVKQVQEQAAAEVKRAALAEQQRLETEAAGTDISDSDTADGDGVIDPNFNGGQGWSFKTYLGLSRRLTEELVQERSVEKQGLVDR